MHIVLIDDSLPFDGRTPAQRPLGGPEKALCGVAPALARRGHEVTVINRVERPADIDGVRWLPWDSPRPPEADVAIAWRKASLLGEVPDATRKVLWLSSDAAALGKPANQERLDRHNPVLVFQGRRHRATFSPWRDFPAAIVPPGIGGAYLEAAEAEPARPPRAVVTSHPRHGLDWVLDLWRDQIRTTVEDAELHVYSAALFRGVQGGEVPEAVQSVFEKARGMAGDGVVIARPLPDPEMAAAYAEATVHLYPGSGAEMYAWTLAESQAAGLPGIAMQDEAAAERLRNGQTGFLVPDRKAFANVAVHLLGHESVARSMARDARLLQRGRDWDAAAADLETLWK